MRLIRSRRPGAVRSATRSSRSRGVRSAARRRRIAPGIKNPPPSGLITRARAARRHFLPRRRRSIDANCAREPRPGVSLTDVRRCVTPRASAGVAYKDALQEMLVRIHSFVALALAARAGLAHAQSSRATADVPVTRVMLFSSGVGYFEHAGTVRGNSATELRFKTSQINDILKSLVLDDRDGGHVAAITYPSQDPIDKTLKSFQVDITGNPSLAQLLNQLRGARVTVQAQAANLTGTIMGVETRRVTTDRGTVDQPVLDLLSGATIRAIDLSSISNLSLDDPQLQEELSRALGALAQ